jgi:hypothetical protein
LQKWFKIVGLVFEMGCQHFHAQNRSNDTVVDPLDNENYSEV